jgi:L-serine dehydratase
MLSVLDIFKIGIGPSSSHTVGPMRIAARATEDARRAGLFYSISRVSIILRGSLALTGVGHAVDKACILGLAGQSPETVDPTRADQVIQQVRESKELLLAGDRQIGFDPLHDIKFCYDIAPHVHPNEMQVIFLAQDGSQLLDCTYYSVGGGFIASAKQLEGDAKDDLIEIGPDPQFPFGSAGELLAICDAQGLTIDEVILANEDSLRARSDTISGLDHIWDSMRDCIDRGLHGEGDLPGHLGVSRRAPKLYSRLQSGLGANEREHIFDWLNVYAMAVNEENAAGGRVVTAPTNGAAGIIPAVLRYYCTQEDGNDIENVRRFLLTSAGIGMLYKQRASISGAEMGCQGEVGVACSMAAAGLAAVWGGTPAQIEHAAEIGMEHNLGLTCDPVGGLVQIPCIERNAVGAVKAVNAARIAIVASETPKVTLDQVIETMRQTGLDMSSKYKETSQGGLAVNVIEC